MMQRQQDAGHQPVVAYLNEQLISRLNTMEVNTTILLWGTRKARPEGALVFIDELSSS